MDHKKAVELSDSTITSPQTTQSTVSVVSQLKVLNEKMNLTEVCCMVHFVLQLHLVQLQSLENVCSITITALDGLEADKRRKFK